MTRTQHHHPGDGCTGELRLLTQQDRSDVQHLTRRILTATAEHRYADVEQHGDHLALHYGPVGEYACAITAARACTTTTPDTTAATPLLTHLQHRHRTTTPADTHTLHAATTAVSTFITAVHHHPHHAEHALTAIYEGPTSQALSFTALLLTHAAHHPTPPPA